MLINKNRLIVDNMALLQIERGEVGISYSINGLASK